MKPIRYNALAYAIHQCLPYMFANQRRKKDAEIAAEAQKRLVTAHNPAFAAPYGKNKAGA